MGDTVREDHRNIRGSDVSVSDESDLQEFPVVCESLTRPERGSLGWAGNQTAVVNVRCTPAQPAGSNDNTWYVFFFPAPSKKKTVIKNFLQREKLKILFSLVIFFIITFILIFFLFVITFNYRYTFVKGPLINQCDKHTRIIVTFPLTKRIILFKIRTNNTWMFLYIKQN